MRHIKVIILFIELCVRQFRHLYKRMLRETLASSHPLSSPRLIFYFYISLGDGILFLFIDYIFDLDYLN